MSSSLKMASNSFLISQPSLYNTSKTNSFIKFSPPKNPLKLKNITSYLYLFITKKSTHFDKKFNAFDEKSSTILTNIASSYLGLSITKKRTHFDQIVNTFDEESSTIIVEEGIEVEEEKGGFKWGNEEGVEVGEVEAVGDGGEEEVGGEYEQVSEDAKLFVGNLPFDVDSEKLAHLFEQAGTVEIAEVIYNRATDQSRGFGFVTMSTVEEADKAVDMLNRYDLNGRLLTVNKAAPRGSRPERAPRVFEPSYRIYVGNLPWDVDDSRLEQIFSEHGKVVDARVVYDRESGRSRGFGFVRMSSESDQNDAIANLDGQSLDGRTIRVNVAEERPGRF